MVKKQNSESVGIPEPLQVTPFMQKPTITDAITYIVDKEGDKIKADPVTQIKEEDSTDSKKSV